MSDNSIAAARRIVSTSTPANSRASLLALQKQMRAMSGSLLHRAGKVNRKPEKNLWIHIKQMNANDRSDRKKNCDSKVASCLRFPKTPGLRANDQSACDCCRPQLHQWEIVGGQDANNVETSHYIIIIKQLKCINDGEKLGQCCIPMFSMQLTL